MSRDDYNELLELVLIFRGEIPQNNKFPKPGACSYARWMINAIHDLGIYLFRKKFSNLDIYLEKKFRDICIIIVLIYVKAWFTAPSTIKAPAIMIKF